MQTYRVSGGRTVLRHKPGTEFEAELSKSQEERLIALGHLEVVEPEPEKAPEPKPSKKEQAKQSEPEPSHDPII